ncbi:LGR4 [Branchiostoma lanceolatum]|uniref:LGR4 protein n=1 Tax=Branchiostoma lanceolatum TaxID=7740 RepID=A0A8J9W1B3_BRALA|nr:LGR4 [Branchiostoma lanceolatum]
MESATPFFILTLLTTTVGKTVDYTGRNLTHVPIDFMTPDAYTVKLSDNDISHLGSFNTTPYIRYLFIDNNRVNILYPRTFQRLGELRVLDLDRNYIVSLRDFVFSDLAALWNLYLSNNLISAISERVFHGLASLEFLELSGNRLSAVPMQAIRLIPSKQLLLVSLMVNNISQIPGDLTSAHPSASYQFQGNPLRCPDEHVSRNGVFDFDDLDKWPRTKHYTVISEHNRSFVEKFFLIKSRYKDFGVLPNTFYVSEHISFDLPFLERIAKHVHVDSYFWDTPTGRHMVESATKALEVEDFTTEDSGMYRNVLKRRGRKITNYWDMLLCLKPQPKEKREQITTISPSDDFSPQGKNSTDTCAGSTNQSCCSYWLRFKPSVHQKFCVAVNPNSPENPVVLFTIGNAIVAVVVTILVILFGIALFCCRTKRETSRSRENISTNTASATLHAGLQAVAVGIPLHNLHRLTEDPTERESNPSAFPLRRLNSRRSHWPAMKTGATQYSFHRGAEAPRADTVGTTEAQVHHYDNDDEADADDEVQNHHYASAAPPPLPAYEGTAAQAVATDMLEELRVSEQPAFQIGNAENGEEEMPYGVAAANSLYQGGSDFNGETLTACERTSSTGVNYCASDSLQVEERLDATSEANRLYQRETAQNPGTLISEHTSSAAANFCAADPNQTETGTTDLYGQQSDHTDMARDITTTSSHESVEDFGILYGNGAAPVEQ